MKRLMFILAMVWMPLLLNSTNLMREFTGKKYRNSSVSICAIDNVSGKVIASLNKDIAIMPASVIKLVTTATALEILGPDYRFKTTLEYTGKIIDGTLNGDIIIRGGGDPSLGSRHLNEDQGCFLKEWIKSIKNAGIKVINGNIIANSEIFDDEPISPFWLWEDIGNYYAAGVYGLGIFDNSFQLNLKSKEPGTTPDIISIVPKMPGLRIENHLVSADNNLDSAYFYGAPKQWTRMIFGTIPSGKDSFSIKGDIPDPPFYFATLLKETLEQNGVYVNGQPYTQGTLPQGYNLNQETRLLYTEFSVPLSKIIEITNKKSDNLFAEYLLRQIALTENRKQASSREGLQVINKFWKDKGLDITSLYMVDGCGLSPMDRVSSDFLARMLVYMATKSKNHEIYENSLPLVGVQGSVSGFLKDSKLEGKVRLKSGTMHSVTCYAGYYRKKSKLYVVVMMLNHMYIPRTQVRKDMEDFLLLL